MTFGQLSNQQLIEELVLSQVRAQELQEEIRQRNLQGKGKIHLVNRSADLARFAVDLVELPIETDIYEFLAKELYGLQSSILVAVFENDSYTREANCKAIKVMDAIRTRLIAAIGHDLIGTKQSELPQKLLVELKNSRVFELEGGFSPFLDIWFPDFAKKLHEPLAGIESGFMIGFVRHGQLFGSALIGLGKGQSIDSNIVETFGSLVSVALQRRRAEEKNQNLQGQLEQAQKMEAIGQLAGGIAHDFNNLLTGITGNISLLQMDLESSDPIYDILTEINEAATRASSLTRQLLAFSRKQIIEPRVLDLNDLVLNLQKMLGRLIGENISLTTRLSSELSQIQADPGHLEQVIVNLAVNSRDAMPSGGKLTIETKNVELNEEYSRSHPPARPGKYVLMSVRDTGTGMDKATCSRIFEPFFTTKPLDHGTGLGLAMVYGIVKQHNGWVEVDSELGQGTIFRIYMPQVNNRKQQTLETPTGTPLPTGHETVLVVEDEAVVRNIAVRILGRQGYRVLQASDGAEALDVVANSSRPINLLVTDMVMPGMSGKQVADQLLEQYPKLRVLYTSGYTSGEIVDHGVLAEGVNFLGKPYSPEDIAVRVREILDSK